MTMIEEVKLVGRRGGQGLELGSKLKINGKVSDLRATVVLNYSHLER